MTRAGLSVPSGNQINPMTSSQKRLPAGEGIQGILNRMLGGIRQTLLWVLALPSWPGPCPLLPFHAGKCQRPSFPWINLSEVMARLCGPSFWSLTFGHNLFGLITETRDVWPGEKAYLVKDLLSKDEDLS